MRPIIAALLVLLASAPAAAQRPGEVRRGPFTLELGSREVATELARLTVPTSRDPAAAGTVEIAYVVLPATTATPGAPIVYLAGGPGGSGISAAEIPYMAELFESLRAVADVVLVDQRGTGRSRPRLACAAEEPLPGDVFANRARMIELYGGAAARCAERLRAEGIDPSDYDTVESAHDLEDLRRALGVERISLLGFSYGTHLALATIREHGERIERAVLVGVEGLDETYKLPSTLDEQIRTLAALTAADPGVGPALPDLEGTLRGVLDRLGREPVVVTVEGPAGSPVELTIGAEGLLYLLRRDVGDTNDLGLFPAWIHELAAGETGILEGFVAKRYHEASRGVSVMSIAMDCASGIDPERAARIEAEIPASIFGRMTNLLDPEACDSVDVEDLGAAFRAPVTSDVPVLLVSGTLDSNTPPSQAERTRGGLTHSAHVVVEGAGHESTLPLAEVRERVARFFGGERITDARLAGPRLEFAPIGEVAEREGGNPAILEALLAGPEQTLLDGGPVELAMETDPAGRPIVEVRVDGKGPYRFGIDWGANIVLVSERVAREAALPVEGRLEAPDGVDRDVARIGELAIGTARFRGLRATVGGFLDESVDGILGYNAFHDAPMTLDYPGAAVRIGVPSLGAPDGERTIALVPAPGGDPRPAVTVRLGDLETVALLDTRGPIAVMLPATLRDRFTAAGESQRARARGPQVGEMELEIVPVAEPLVLGGTVVERPVVAFRAPAAEGGPSPLFEQAIVGGPLLRQFALTLDLAAGAVRFDREGDGPIVLPIPRPRPPGS